MDEASTFEGVVNYRRPQDFSDYSKEIDYMFKKRWLAQPDSPAIAEDIDYMKRRMFASFGAGLESSEITKTASHDPEGKITPRAKLEKLLGEEESGRRPEIVEGTLHTTGRPETDIKFESTTISTGLRTEIRYNQAYPYKWFVGLFCFEHDELRLHIPRGCDTTILFWGRPDEKSWIPTDRKIVPGVYMVSSHVSARHILHTITHERYDVSQFAHESALKIFLGWDTTAPGVTLVMEEISEPNTAISPKLTFSMNHYLVNVDTQIRRDECCRTYVTDPKELEKLTRNWIYFSTNVNRLNKININEVDQVFINRLHGIAFLPSEIIAFNDRPDYEVNTACVFRTLNKPLGKRVLLLVDGEVQGFAFCESLDSRLYLAKKPKRPKARGEFAWMVLPEWC